MEDLCARALQDTVEIRYRFVEDLNVWIIPNAEEIKPVEMEIALIPAQECAVLMQIVMSGITFQCVVVQGIWLEIRS